MCPSTDDGSRNVGEIHTHKHTEYYSALKREGNPIISNYMGEVEEHMLNEINQTEKNKYCMVSHIWDLKK